jgi:hypothetical protein
VRGSTADASPPATVVSGSKRKQRGAAAKAAKAAAALALAEAGGAGGGGADPAYTAPASPAAVDKEEEYISLPQVKTRLWEHQERSMASVIAGVKAGQRGHADASAVGAGKTLVALATIVRVAAVIKESGRKRSGALVMLPTPSLIKEWLQEIAIHTAGFHVIEQRETGELFSLTYGKKDPPIDGNALVISSLDRVSAHPFVRQAACAATAHRTRDLRRDCMRLAGCR